MHQLLAERVATGDVDLNGWPDLYLLQGGGRSGCDPLPNRLFMNRGGGTFAELRHIDNTSLVCLIE